jgi:hypothetical protein
MNEGNSRVRLLDSRYNEKTGVWEETPSTLPSKNKGSEPSLPYAFTWVRSFSENRKYLSTKATIDSPHLESLIKQTCRASSSTNFTTFEPKFDTLVWDWDKLEAAAGEKNEKDSKEEKVAREDLELLLEQIKSSSELYPYFEQRDLWAECVEIPYDFLWTLFPPGELVCSQVIFEHPQAFIAREYQYLSLPAKNGGEKNFFELTCWSYDWNGETFSRVSGVVKIERYTGAKAINTLKFYPIKYHVDKNGHPAVDQLRATLKTRGQKFRAFCTAPKGSQLFYCDGPVLSKQAGFSDMDTSNSYVSQLFLTPQAEDAVTDPYDSNSTPLARLEPRQAIIMEAVGQG